MRLFAVIVEKADGVFLALCDFRIVKVYPFILMNVVGLHYDLAILEL